MIKPTKGTFVDDVIRHGKEYVTESVTFTNDAGRVGPYVPGRFDTVEEALFQAAADVGFAGIDCRNEMRKAIKDTCPQGPQRGKIITIYTVMDAILGKKVGVSYLNNEDYKHSGTNLLNISKEKMIEAEKYGKEYKFCPHKRRNVEIYKIGNPWIYGENERSGLDHGSDAYKSNIGEYEKVNAAGEYDTNGDHSYLDRISIGIERKRNGLYAAWVINPQTGEAFQSMKLTPRQIGWQMRIVR